MTIAAKSFRGFFPLLMVTAFGLVAFSQLAKGQPPNVLVNLPSPPATEQHNSALAWSEFIAGEGCAVWSEFPPPGFFGPVFVGYAFTVTGGAAWFPAAPGGIIPATPPYAVEWNPGVGSHPLGGYICAAAAFLPGAPWFSPNQIVAHASGGAPAPFGAGAIVSLPNAPGFNWQDYPNIAMDDNPANPPPGFASAHVAWVWYFDATGGDTDGNGNPVDDAGDTYEIWYAYSRTLAGPAPIYPAFSGPMPLGGGPQTPNEMAAERPSLAVMGPPGNGLVPTGGLYVAWTDAAGVWINYSPAPVLGAPFAGAVLISPIAPVPPVLVGGVKAASNVSIAIGAGPCPGFVLAAWSAGTFGDADIFFSFSPTGMAGTWALPIRVNQDPVGNGQDQWEPKIHVDPVSGAITVTYLDRRADPPNVGIQTWQSTSLDCGLTWSDCFLSDLGPIPPISTFGLAPAPFYIGDYLGSDFNLLNGPGFTWNDGRNGGDQDVYFETACAPCPCMPGDPNGSGIINIADPVYLLQFIFAGGPAPVPYPLCSGDANCNCLVNIADVVYLISYIFSGGPAPCNCTTWLANCGWPLRK